RDGAEQGAEDDPDDDTEREDTEEAAGVGGEEEAEQQAPEEAERRALPDPDQRGAAGGQASRDLLDITEPGADDPRMLDREALIRQPVDRTLGRLVVRGGCDRAPGGGRHSDGLGRWISVHLRCAHERPPRVVWSNEDRARGHP